LEKFDLLFSSDPLIIDYSIDISRWISHIKFFIQHREWVSSQPSFFSFGSIAVDISNVQQLVSFKMTDWINYAKEEMKKQTKTPFQI
jgi:hypothetical protein